MNKNKKLASVMCVSTIMTSVLPVFATQTLTNDDLANLKETEVLYNKSASYMVTIPKTITLGSDKTSTYSVKVEGDISSDQEIYVSPVDSISTTDTIDFYMEDQSTSALKKDAVEATVTPTKTVWNFEDVANATEVTDNKIEALKLTSGSWRGTFNFEINLRAMGEEDLNSAAGFYDANGVQLCSWTTTESKLTYSAVKPLFEQYPNVYRIVIPDTVTEIGADVFWGKNVIIEVPDTVTKIGEYAFREVPLVIYNGPATNTSSWNHKCLNGYIEGDLIYSDETKTTVCAPVPNASENIVIPEGVTTIKYDAFRNCSTLKSINIPNSVTEIGGYAFYNCTSLTEITIPASVTEIGIYAFGNCYFKTSDFINNSSATDLNNNNWGVTLYDEYVDGMYIKDNCVVKANQEVSSVITIPEGITSINNHAFENCNTLTEVILPSTITKIGDYAFFHCENLSSVTYKDTKYTSLFAITVEFTINSINVGTSAFDLTLFGSLL